MARMTAFKNVEGLNRALRSLTPIASEQLRDASVKIAADVAAQAASKGRALGGVAALVAPTARGSRDRIPSVKIGNSSPIERGRPGKGQTLGDVMWGAEFGGGRRTTTHQFRPWRGSGTGAGYFLWPTIRAMDDKIHDQYSEALDNALQAMK